MWEEEMKTFLVCDSNGKTFSFDKREEAELFARKHVLETGDPTNVYVLETSFKREVTKSEHHPPPPTQYPRAM